MASMRGLAEDSYNAKLNRMGVKIRTADTDYDEGIGHANPVADGSQGMSQGKRAPGYENDAEIARTYDSKQAKPRLDRPAYKKGGRVKGTTVNVIVAPQAPAAPPMMPKPPMPMPPPMAPPGPPPGLAGSPPGGPMGGLPGGGAMPRKNGGRVARANGGSVPDDINSPTLQRRIAKIQRVPVEDVAKDARDATMVGVGTGGPYARKNGGTVKMNAGAGGGEGRLEKVRAYGKNAKK